MADPGVVDPGGLSLWLDDLVRVDPDALRPRASLPGDLEADVVIIGAGLTGLWTAYYLACRDPGLRIVVLERAFAGFGASGRNGGWCSALFPSGTASLERRHGLEQALAMRRAMIDTVDEVGRIAAAEGIDCDYVKGGTRLLARNAPQLRRAREHVIEAERYGVDDLRMVPGGPASALATVIDPACARLHPGKLVRGLARVVERLGVTIFEGTTVRSWEAGTVHTQSGRVRAESIVVATEGYTPGFSAVKRRLLPLYSLMIASEPLPAAFWEEAGIKHGQTFSDYRHLLVYGQRTADDRLAFGGRGARYHWGSSIRPEFDRVERVFDHLRRALVELFPAVKDAAITHRWGGPLGVPRDWHASVDHDAATGIAWAGGYVGDGVSTTNLAGRTLADLVTGRSTALTALPWVGHRSRNWEPEPLRWLGANLGLAAMGLADGEERVTRRPSVTARLMRPLIGQ